MMRPEHTPADGLRLVKLAGSCPHCGLVKHQIDASEEHAFEVLNAAFAEHITEEHPDATVPAGDS